MLVRECYGFEVVCSVPPEAREVVDQFFGSAEPRSVAKSGQVVRLAFDVVDGQGVPSVDPPHTEEVIASDPIVIDTGNSRAMITPDDWSARITLARTDLADQIVWGRWILERLFLYLVCRSPRHYPLHAGGIRLDDRVTLLSAPTGTGKSTLSFWCLHRGAELLGEDIMVRHLDDEPGRVWGYPRVVYLDAATIARSTELDPSLITEIDDGDKSRVRLPEALSGRLGSEAVRDAMVFLVRDGSTGARELTVDDAIERCRDDFTTGKADSRVLADIKADLRALLRDVPILEFALTDDLDECFAGLRTLL
jgi:hypothetical protein